MVINDIYMRILWAENLIYSFKSFASIKIGNNWFNVNIIVY